MTGRWPRGDRTHPRRVGSIIAWRGDWPKRSWGWTLAQATSARPVTLWKAARRRDQTRWACVRWKLTYADASIVTEP